LTSSYEGETAYIDADLRQPDRNLGDKALRDTLDLSQPVGLGLVAVLHEYAYLKDLLHRGELPPLAADGHGWSPG
jgi:hypothetical protein